MNINKRKLHHYWRNIRGIKTWHLMVAFLVTVPIAAWSLRQNNLRMIELREAVVVADRQDGDTVGALQELSEHVFSHMNTNIGGPIQLVHEYNREIERLSQEAANRSQAQAVLYDQAKAQCDSQGLPESIWASCVSDYVRERTPDNTNPLFESPAIELYTYSFASPGWTLDVAGISLFVACLLLFLVVARIVAGKIITSILKSRY